MKKGQEKGGEMQGKYKTLLGSSDCVNLNTLQSPAITPLTSRRSPHTSIGSHKKSDYREVDKTDNPKKNNRRRERKKGKKSDEKIDAFSTSYSRPKIKKHSHIKPVGIMPKICQISALGATNTKQSDLVEHKFNCEINNIKGLQTGKMFRRRNDKYKYINLKSFSGLARTCIFKTDIAKLSAALKNLSLGSVGKKKNRKYFESHRQGTIVKALVHSEIVVTAREIDSAGNEVVETISVVQDQTQGGTDQERQPESSKKPGKHKKEKHRRHKLEKKLAKEKQEVFPSCLSEEEVKTGLECRELVKGFIRVNPKNPRDSYVSNLDSTKSDYHITSVADRNRALDGDEVLLKIKPEEEWQGVRKTTFVIKILEKIHPRTTVGTLKPSSDAPGFALFSPRDKRMPIMHIPEVSWPQAFKTKPKSYTNILFVAKLIEWPEPNRAIGVITQTLGMANDLQVETRSILEEFCLDITPFSPDMTDWLPKQKEIPAKELEYREDIRKECVFTIDPLTARDLDDAVSVKELANGNYEIGVHISDASYYLSEGTPLDKMVSSKATTIYLVNNVYHMLPVELCLHCSLLPGQDKLAFSVFWEMDQQGNIFNTRFARTVLNSCAQLAYEHAQQMIEEPNKEFKTEDLPKIWNNFTAKDLSKTVNILQKIAVNLRNARIQNGSLRIDQVKLLFSLSPRNGEPLDFIVYENKESHRLIEEFMLLANISVAKKIDDTFPDIAFLRCHEQPKYTMLLEAQKSLETCGILVDISSSGGIHSSLRKYITDDYQGFCRGIVLNHIFAKPMTRARYFCAGMMEGEYSHYALSVPIYTHFTSPIRRYADIMVHRLLAASLGYSEKPNWSTDEVAAIAANCNKQKYNAKRAGEASSDLYLAHYIEKHQPCIQECVVVDVKDRSFDAIVLKTGSMVRIYQKNCQGNPTWTIEHIPLSSTIPINARDKNLEHEKKVNRLIIDFPSSRTAPEPLKMVIEMFSVVKVKLNRIPNSYKLEAYLLKPLGSKTFQKSDSDQKKHNTGRNNSTTRSRNRNDQGRQWYDKKGLS